MRATALDQVSAILGTGADFHCKGYGATWEEIS